MSSRGLAWWFMVLGLLGPVLVPQASPPIEWAQKYYNPQPLADDITLPLPCGGAMAFRKVYTEAVGPLGDYRVEIGNSEEQSGFAEHSRTVHVAGAFSDTPQSRYLLFGKYEVSELQYAALTESDCPKPTLRKRLPQARVSWHDAVAFTDRYSQWLRRVATDFPPCAGSEPVCIPWEDGEPGFVRLPTEVEWEYAARGGAQVSRSEFRERIFPTPDGMARYIWFAGTQSANGKAQLTGTKEPNPLGLHDMLGNVAEIVLEPFRLNRLDRLHGQAGGFIVRGGDFLTSGEAMRSAMRQEVPYYDEHGPVRSKTIGFRVVVTVPVITSPSRLQQIKQAWSELGKIPPQKKPMQASEPQERPLRLDATPLDDPIEELAVIARAATDPNMQNRLLLLRSVVRANLQALSEQRDDAAREALRLGGVLCQKLRDDNREVEQWRKMLDACVEGSEASNPRCQSYQAKIQANTEVVQYNLGVYADAVLATAQNYPRAVLDAQLQLLIAEINRKQFTALIPFIEQFHAQAIAYGNSWQVRRELWNRQCAGI